jgi:transposase
MVDLVRSGRTPEEPAREFEPTAQSIAERDAGKRLDAPTSAEREEPGRLRRENHRLRQERDILAKAAVRAAACSCRHDSSLISEPPGNRTPALRPISCPMAIREPGRGDSYG